MVGSMILDNVGNRTYSRVTDTTKWDSFVQIMAR